MEFSHFVVKEHKLILIQIFYKNFMWWKVTLKLHNYLKVCCIEKNIVMGHSRQDF